MHSTDRHIATCVAAGLAISCAIFFTMKARRRSHEFHVAEAPPQRDDSNTSSPTTLKAARSPMAAVCKAESSPCDVVEVIHSPAFTSKFEGLGTDLESAVPVTPAPGAHVSEPLPGGPSPHSLQQQTMAAIAVLPEVPSPDSIMTSPEPVSKRLSLCKGAKPSHPKYMTSQQLKKELRDLGCVDEALLQEAARETLLQLLLDAQGPPHPIVSASCESESSRTDTS